MIEVLVEGFTYGGRRSRHARSKDSSRELLVL